MLCRLGQTQSGAVCCSDQSPGAMMALMKGLLFAKPALMTSRPSRKSGARHEGKRMLRLSIGKKTC